MNPANKTKCPHSEYVNAICPLCSSTKPVCTTCNDTHMMWSSRLERDVMCTACPRPCERCRQGPYCATTPCGCSCHKPSTTTLPTKEQRQAAFDFFGNDQPNAWHQDWIAGHVVPAPASNDEETRAMVDLAQLLAEREAKLMARIAVESIRNDALCAENEQRASQSERDNSVIASLRDEVASLHEVMARLGVVDKARDLPRAYCPYPGLHAADCDCRGEGGAR